MARLAQLGAAVYPIGQSVLGNDILCAETGAGDPKIIVTGGIHARENVSARLVARQAFDAAGTAAAGRIYFVPMLNPDGALLIEKGAGIAARAPPGSLRSTAAAPTSLCGRPISAPWT